MGYIDPLGSFDGSLERRVQGLGKEFLYLIHNIIPSIGMHDGIRLLQPLQLSLHRIPLACLPPE